MTAIKEVVNKIVDHPKVSLLVIFVLTLAAYSNIFSNDFVLDDYDLVADWPLIQDFRNFPQFFISFIPPDGQPWSYSPIKTFFYAISYHLWGENLLEYHLFSIFIHLISTFVVFKLTSLFLKNSWIAFWTTLLFGLHPVHVESLTHITNSFDTIGILFLLVSYYFYIRSVPYRPLVETFATALSPPHKFDWDKTKNAGGIFNFNYKMSMIFAGLAIFTNELSVSLPLLILVYDLYFRGEKIANIKIAMRTIPFFLLVAFYTMMKWMVLGSWTQSRYLYDSFYLTMLVVFKAWVKYLALSFLPGTLTYNHILSPGIFSLNVNDFDKYAVLSQSFLDPQILLSLIFVVAVFYFAFKIYKNHPVTLFGLSWFFISLLPASQIVPGEIFFAEKYLYTGIFGICLLIAYGLYQLFDERILKLKRYAPTLATSLLLFFVTYYGLKTYVRNRDWKDQITLLKSAVQVNPHSASLYIDLGLAYIDFGSYKEALEQFKKAASLQPDNAHIYFSMAEGYHKLKQYEEELRSLKKAVELNPDFAEAYYNLVGVYDYLGQETETEMNLDKSMELYLKQGHLLEATEGWEAYNGYLLTKDQNSQETDSPDFP